MTKAPLSFRVATELPKEQRGGGVGRATPFSPLVTEARANPGTWYELDCDNERQAANRAGTLRKTHELDAHSRGSKVFFRSVDGVEASAAE